uniref:(northern house mosquito) hypothetical protein n=1 Tax=Culex pipiens TaxID=7175 RepID=A0A8D8BF88_CULPI
MVQILGGPGDDQQGGGRDAFADHQDGQLRTGPRHQHQQTVHPVLELDRAGEIRQHLVPVHGQGVFVNIDGRQQLIRGNLRKLKQGREFGIPNGCVCVSVCAE